VDEAASLPLTVHDLDSDSATDTERAQTLRCLAPLYLYELDTHRAAARVIDARCDDRASFRESDQYRSQSEEDYASLLRYADRPE